MGEFRTQYYAMIGLRRLRNAQFVTVMKFHSLVVISSESAKWYTK